MKDWPPNQVHRHQQDDVEFIHYMLQTCNGVAGSRPKPALQPVIANQLQTAVDVLRAFWMESTILRQL